MLDCTTSGHFDFVQTVNVITEALYPEEQKKTARAKVRNRIQRAANIGDIRIVFLDNKTHLEVEPFLRWALQTWPVLSNYLSSLPPHISAHGEINMGDLSASGEMHSLPDTVDQLQQLCARLLSENSTLHPALEKTKGQLIGTQAELDVFKARDALRRQRASDAGKQGGRGNEK